MNVIHPMNMTASTIYNVESFRNANDTPTASASILVATASRNITFALISAFTSSSPPNDSFIILPPIKSRSTNAIQCDHLLTRSAKKLPSTYPSVGISAWNPPNHTPAITICFTFMSLRESPLHMDTANASIDKPTASINSSTMLINFPPTHFNVSLDTKRDFRDSAMLSRKSHHLQ